LEHLHHFDLSHDPFQNEPDLRFYFASAHHRDVQLRLDRGLRQHKGLCVMTGEGGTGKTLLARRILDTLEEEVFDANLMVMLAGAADAESVLSRFARQVGV
jgi:type II secretory pathway predicted ATPase ExeA